MITIAIIILLFCIPSIIHNVRAKKAARAKQEAQWKAQVEREQARLAKAQEKQGKAQAAAWERQRKEDARRDAQLAKHEEQIRKMQFQLEQATADIDHLTNTLSELDAMLDYLKMEQSGTSPGGKEYAKYQTKIISLENRVHSTETRLAKAQHAKAEAERKLA